MDEPTDAPSIIRWEAPPTRVRAQGRVDWTPVSDTLRARSGEWAVLAEVRGKSDSDDRRLRALGASIKSGNVRAFAPQGEFEATTRMVGDTVRLYARHVGQR